MSDLLHTLISVEKAAILFLIAVIIFLLFRLFLLGKKVAVLTTLYQKQADELGQKANLESSFQTLNDEILLLKKDYEFAQNEAQNLLEKKEEILRKNAILQDELNEKKTSCELYLQKVKFYEQKIEELENNYQKNLALLEHNLSEQNEKNSKLIYEENTKILLKNSQEFLQKLLNPLDEKVRAYHETLAKHSANVETSVKTMFETSLKLSKKTDEFAALLKGDKKARGDFGEIMLRQCLLSSGLKENEHFFMQNNFKDDENHNLRPDAVVYFEPQKCVIIDSKFSLPSENSELAKNLRARVDELAKKDYEKVVKNANEFVLLFVPYQSIIDEVLQSDENIFRYAESKKIFIVSPTTLFMGLKMIYFGWQNYQISENVKAIFDEFGKFYDKFSLLYEDYSKFKNQISNSLQKLDTHFFGRGNIANRVENLRKLGAKNKKVLALNE